MDNIYNIIFIVYNIKMKEKNNMTARAINFKMDEFEINDMKHVASICITI